MKKIIQEKDRCPQCGHEFNCSKSKSCWCFEHEMNIETLEKLTDAYDSCLCPTCIEKLST